ncbi:MAG: NAD(P)H-dependent oxidoreductase subunit E, partial [Clostridia bacterium]|nr:NAD(P)H-dependent oxidoreductase subunit E [Clostridia bacterium]
MYRNTVLICGGTGCHSNHSSEIYDKFVEEIAANGIKEDVLLVKTGCFGLCAVGPVVIIYPEGAFYSTVSVSDVPELVSEHLIKGRIVERLIYRDKEVVTKALSETNFYKSQTRVALRNCGVINPEDIDEYIAYDG